MRRVDRWCQFAAVIAFALPALAQVQPPPETGMPELSNYSPKEYGGAPQVWSILQDRRGVLYFGVAKVILEYDGVTWRKIPISTRTARSLAMDAAGRIWVGGVGDFGYLEPDASGTLQYVSLAEKIPPDHRRAFTDVWRVLSTPRGNFFQSRQRIFRWDGKRMQVWASKTTFEALSDVRGRIYTSQGGIGLQEVVDDELRELPGGDAYKSSGLLLHPYGETSILVSARQGSLTLYDGGKATPFPTGADEYLKKSQIYRSFPLPGGGFCITTTAGGAVILEHDGRLRRIVNKAAGLNDQAVYTALTDREGALWLGLSQGIARIDANSPITVFSTVGVSTARYQGGLYFSSFSGGALFRLAANSMTGLPSPQALPSTATQADELRVFKDPTGKTPDHLLAGTNLGVMKIEGDTVSPAVAGLQGTSQSVSSMGQSRKSPNRIFVGRHSEGLSSLRWDGGRWVDEGRLPNFTGRVYSVAEDPGGTLWAGVDGGLLRVEVPATGMRDATFQRFTEKEGMAKALNFTEFAAGHLFAIAGGKMLRWDESSRKFVTDNRFLLPLKDADSQARLFELENGDIWSVNKSDGEQRQGMFRRQADGAYRLDEEPFRGLSRFQVEQVRLEPDGSLWIAGDDGVVRFDQRVKPPARPSFSALVRSVHSGTEAIVFGGTSDASEPAPRLPFARNSLQFEFAAPTYGSEAGTGYRYLLEGADKDWSGWDKRKDSRYSNLGPGSYRFRVQARTVDGRVGEDGVYSFTILPPWYRTWLAYSVYGVLFLLLAYGGRQRVINRERQKARLQTEALEATVAARTAEIASQKENIELLGEIGKEITASLDLDTILFKLYESVNRIVDATIFGVGLYRPEQRLIEYSLAIESGKRYAPYTRDTGDKNQFAVWCIDHRKPVLINDAATEYGKYISSYKHGEGIMLEDGSVAQAPASMMYLPLVAQDRVLGVLSIQSFKKNAYTAQHLSLLESLAAYTTIALDNAGAYRTVKEREQEMAAINRITQAISSQLDKDRLIQLVGDQIRDLFRAQIAYVAMLDRSTMMLHFPYHHGDSSEPTPFGRGLTSQIIRTGRPLLINEDIDGARGRMGVERIGRQAASYLGVPIPAGGEMVGVISVQSTDQEGRFTEADQKLLATIATSMGVAFHNAQLFEEAQQARAAAEEADKAKSSFLASMSHELRTPLNAIIGYSEMLKEEAEDQDIEGFVPDLEKIHAAGRHLLELINAVLDISKIEAGKMELFLETFAVDKMLAGVIPIIQPLAKKGGNRLSLKAGGELGTMHADVTKLRQTLFNLMGNACKFTKDGEVTLSVERAGDRICFAVTDTGIGMTREQVGKLFQSFTQADNSISGTFGGTGLGLAISQHFCQMMGGKILVESEPGRGTTFRFSLPAAVAETKAPAGPSAGTGVPNTGGEGMASVLVIDDDEAVNDLIRRSLGRQEFIVFSAPNGPAGLRLARELRPDAIILDVMMPGTDGWSVLSDLKSDPVTAHIPVVMVTIVDDRNLGYSLGASDYFTKPIDRDRLVLAVSNLCGLRGSALVVDDDEEVRDMLRRLLAGQGWDVRVAENGRVALERMAEKIPDAILLDLVMPEMDGFGFLEEVQRNPAWKSVPVIVLTSKDITEADHEALNGGVVRILQKGGTPSDQVLRELSQQVLARVRNKHAENTVG